MHKEPINFVKIAAAIIPNVIYSQVPDVKRGKCDNKIQILGR